jgi:ERCC4-type nuclease
MTDDPDIKPRLHIVDSNEPESIRLKLVELGWTQGRLATGDYFMHTSDFKRVGVERKAVQDLMASLGDRLAKQLTAMLDYYDYSVLMIEGSLKNINGQMFTARGLEHWSWDAVWNFLQTWQMRGVTIQLSADEGQTVHRVANLFAYFQQPVHTGGYTHRQVGDARILAFPSGVGEKTALSILGKFGSLRAVANAKIDELLQCEGVGPKRAEAIAIHFARSK